MSPRLWVTDVLDPAVPAVIAALQTDALAAGRPPWTVHGLIEIPRTDRPRAAEPEPPAGVRSLMSGPAMDDPDWASWVVTHAVLQRVDAVLPCSDRAAQLLAAQATTLRELGGALVCPPAPQMALVQDRWTATARLNKAGIPTVPALRARSSADLATAARTLGYPDRTVTVSPRRVGAGGVWSVRERTGLATTHPMPALPLYAVMAAVSAGPKPVDLVVQHEPAGPDTEVDILAADGTVLAAVARTVHRVSDGEWTDATVGPTPDQLTGLVDQVVAALNWTQLLTIRIAWDRANGSTAVRALRSATPLTAGLAGHAGAALLAAAIELAVSGRPPVLPAPTRAAVRRSWTVRAWPA